MKAKITPIAVLLSSTRLVFIFTLAYTATVTEREAFEALKWELVRAAQVGLREAITAEVAERKQLDCEVCELKRLYNLPSPK